LITGVSHLAYRPIKFKLSASKSAFFEKFVELIFAKIPIYITGIEASTAFFLPVHS
jgi:hypothetical protein